MKHTLQINDNYLVASLKDKIYAYDASLFRNDILQNIEQGFTTIKIDLSHLTYIDCSGLNALVTVHKRVKEKNGVIVLFGIKGIAAELLRRTHLDTVLTIQ